ncbi:MAG: hypothetical protein HN413_18205 [Chloroflexi bacterium]|jgi:hypothetical protein|nr:hypothetical protein [Chloroflexota bacterium]
MQTVRRVYRYLIAFISLEVMIWGIIQLARTTFSRELIGSTATQLASALSFIFVGIPVFLLHWIPAQRSAATDSEEYSSRVRAWFLYGALLSTLIPVAQNGLALINRVGLSLIDIPVERAIFGGSQNWADNLIAMLVNALVAGYIFRVTRQNWEKTPPGSAFSETRRLYRYLWGLYSLGLVVGGIIAIGLYVFSTGEIIGSSPHERWVNGITLLLIGIPLWVVCWRTIHASLELPEERQSYLRLGILYTLSLIGVGGVIIPLGLMLNTLFRALFGEAYTASAFLQEIGAPLSNLIAWGGVWLYYGRALKADIATLPAAPRRASLRRAYTYILSFFGLVAAFIGIHMLLAFIIDTAFDSFVIGELSRQRLAAALATLMVGAPLWLQNWRQVLHEAAQADDAGDRARRSIIRKIYLYFLLFASVIGLMATGGNLVFELLKALLGESVYGLARTVLTLMELLLLFAGVLTYHWMVLRKDLRLAERNLAERHAQYPVLIVTDESSDISQQIEFALQRGMPALPVAVFSAEAGAPEAAFTAAAAILPAHLSVAPPEALRLWLQEFQGERLVLPTPVDQWYFVLGSGQDRSRVIQQTVKVIRHLAEGEDVPLTRDHSVGRIILYVAGGLFALQLLFGLLGLLLSF